MRNQIKFISALFIIALLCAVAAKAQVATGGGYRLEQSVIAGGGTSADAMGNQFSLTGAIGQAVAGTISTNAPFTARGGFFTPEVFAPTAAGVTISGRARTSSGKGVRSVAITLMTADGATHTVLSSAFGYYRFADVAAGQTVILTAAGKRFVFSQPTQILNLTEDVSDVDFIAVEQWFLEQ